MSYTRKLKIGSDGSIAYGINSTNNYVFDVTSAMVLSDTNIGDLDRLTSIGSGFPMVNALTDVTSIFFNQNTRITKFQIFHAHTVSCQLEIKYSTNTTNGIDGTWTSYATFGGNNYTAAIAPNTLVELDCADIATCKGLQIKFYGTEKPYGLIRLFNVFGEHLSPKFLFFDEANSVELTGDNPLAFSGPFSKYTLSSEVKRFSIKNVDSISHSFNIDIRPVGSNSGNIAYFMGAADIDDLLVGTGTITLTSGTKTITGIGTSFSASDIGKIIKASGNYYIVGAVTTVTDAELTFNATGNWTGVYSLSHIPSSGLITGAKGTNSFANLALVLNCPANSNVAVGQTEYSVNVTAN